VTWLTSHMDTCVKCVTWLTLYLLYDIHTYKCRHRYIYTYIHMYLRRDMTHRYMWRMCDMTHSVPIAWHDSHVYLLREVHIYIHIHADTYIEIHIYIYIHTHASLVNMTRISHRYMCLWCDMTHSVHIAWHASHVCLLCERYIYIHTYTCRYIYWYIYIHIHTYTCI